MRILIATDAWEPQVNGVVRTLSRTIAEMRAMGHEVDVISPDQFPTLPMPTYPEIKLALGAYEGMQDRFRAFEPEAIHIATEGPVGLAARRLCLEWKLPFTTSYHTRFPEYISARFPVPTAAGYAYMRWFHKPSGRVMVATPTMREELEKHGFRNLSYWTRGVDTDLFRMRPGEQPGVEGWPEPEEMKGLPRPIFLNVGRVAVEKNIEAFVELKLPGSMVVVGDGPSREDLMAKYPKVVFTGSRFGEALAAYFAWSDVFVFPSLTDTFGLVILEAMATGAPVAAFPGAGFFNEDLRQACLDCVALDRQAVRRYAEGFSWRASAEQFVANLEPYPEAQKVKLWKRLRRLARLRRARAAYPPAGFDLGA
jgi:glycosyltransferase involved in cell wall biosynthesis